MISTKKYATLFTVLFLVASPLIVSLNTSSGTYTLYEEETEGVVFPGQYPFEEEYPSVQQLNDWYDDLVDENPEITQKIHLGESWEGRDIWAIKVSDNVEEKQDEPSVFIHGNIHAREWSSNQVAAYYLWRLVEDYGSNETITWLVNNRQIYVAPMVNPDGYIYDGDGDLSQRSWWRKNRNDSTPTNAIGVDLNRNWDIVWDQGNDDPTSNTYHGESPFSEYETQHLRDFILSKDIDSYNDIHSYAGTLLIPWAHTTDPSPHDNWYRDMADDMTSMTSLLGDDDEQYSYGQPGDEIGYSAPGGAYDWVYEETGAISLCYEIYTGGSGFYPPEEDIMDINKDLYDSLVYQARIADIDLGDGSKNLYPPAPYLVYGSVSNDIGEPIIETNVTIENKDTEESIYTNTDQNGYYELNFGNFIEEGYDNSDTFSIQAGDFSTNFTIGNEWGQRKDLEDVEANPPSVTLIKPSGGESWSVGDELSIEWETEQGDGPISGITLEYTTEEKVEWYMIAEKIEDTGSYNWTVPGGPTSEAIVRVTVYDENGLNDTDTSDPFKITLNDVTDVPNWGIGSSWNYNQDIWMDQGDGDWLMMNESITYTVADIGFHEYNESTYYSYNLSLEGNIKDGEGEFEGYQIEIEDGDIEGYMLVRVSDLGVIVDHQYREIDGYVEGEYVEPEFDAFVNLTRYYQTVVEEYDFPLWRDETFWANTTVETFGDYKFEDEYGFIEEEEEFHEVEEINQINHVNSELKEVEVPAGTYTTYEVETTMENETSKLGYVNNWYNETIGWFVKQDTLFPSDEFEADIERELIDSTLQSPNHTQEIKPNPQYIGSEVTISGHMKGHSETTLSIYIPYSVEKQNWTVETDSEGYYELTIQVPHIKDNTPTHSYYSSEGIITSVEDDESEKIVTTLVTRMETYELEIYSTSGGKVEEPGEGEFKYDYGETVDLEAVAEDNHHFVEWTGDVKEMEDTESAETLIKMFDDYAITAEFVIDTYDLTIDSTKGGEVVKPGECTFEYDHGTIIDIEAEPEEGYQFVEWTGDVDEIADIGEKETTIEMVNDYAITAEFKIETYELEIYSSQGGKVEEPGEGTFEYDYGETVNIEAIAEEGYQFLEWTGETEQIRDLEASETTIEILDDYAITAEFEEESTEYELTINAEEGGTTDPEPGIHVYEEGTKVTIEAISHEGYEFVEWTGDETGTEKTITVTIDEDKEITARFEEEVVLEEYELTLDIEGNGTIMVKWDAEERTISEEEAFLIEEGTEVTLSANPDEDWQFIEWGGYDEDYEEITITIDENKEIIAHFEKEEKDEDETVGFTLPLLIFGTVIAVAIYSKKER